VSPSSDGDRATTLELFFDLVYAFAFTQVIAMMAHGVAPSCFVEGFIVLSLFWWSWCSFSWLANQAHADEGLVKGAFVLATVAIFIACIAIPDAFRDAPGAQSISAAAVVVACYGMVRLIHLGVYLFAAGEDAGLRRQIVVTLVTALLPTLALLSVGAAIGGTAQRWIWLAAVCYDFAAVLITAKRTQGWRVQSAAHFAERYALIVLLALGESIVAVAAGLGGAHLAWRVVVGAGLSILLAVGLYFAYFDRLADQLRDALERSSDRERARLAEDACTYLHFPIIAGVILTALGIDVSMSRLGAPDTGTTAGWALAGGIALFLAGTTAAAVRSGCSWPVPRTIAVVAFLCLAPLLTMTPSLVAVGVTTAGVVVLVILERLTPGSPTTDSARSAPLGA
jgi:low temperature requirement protein LtrA